MIQILNLDMPGDVARARIEANLAREDRAGVVGHSSRARDE